MSFKEGRVVDDGGEQGREAPQQQGGEELGDDWVLQGVRGDVSGRGSLVGSACFAYLPPSPTEPGPHGSQGPMSEVQNMWRAKVEGGEVGAKATCTTPG